ncbi:hypothetical protein SELMODRAFT_267178 [Selaginella moellendorffii]|uniref:homogentisate 1,2-dioxygenase n=1 Tax=Selaginella moellendorffii TaxID=88036 RepID=D8RBB3_SELML|nr:homogentisate 1,2-dioxygenase [Selaginella moellendorffii]EFJ30466.1 hypothetical protein SELMODRAFT_267178 [Selaginella moellendorffii]|eukprot:XP_002968212.1 homogentisate 1,2-dioxygenase [Selaginella moellendorffii]
MEKRECEFENLEYQRGFGNHFRSEALQGALPNGQNSPLHCPYGLYAEQLSGTAFTTPRKQNFRSWLYRIKPSVGHEPFQLYSSPSLNFAGVIDKDRFLTTPTQLRWKPLECPEHPRDFVHGLFTMCGAGSPFLRHGYMIHIYVANKSMEDCALANADGDFLIVPQQGRLWIKTEFGKLQVCPGEIVVLQLGMRFAIELPDATSRGYILEVFSGHFQLPDLGLIGANGLAEVGEFETPVAWFENKHCEAGFTIFHKFGGQMFSAKQEHSPFNVVAWHGNYAPYKYDLRKFCPVNTVLFDHADPSINTVLTVPSEKPGVAVVDFVVFPPRWSVAEHTFRPPYFHRNCMSEFMGLISGSYEAKAGGFLPGGASLHCCMTPHGVDATTYENTISATSQEPVKVSTNALAFMFESSLTPQVAISAYNSQQRDAEYHQCWSGLNSHFALES